jgi:hypothetical protein
MIDIDSVVQRAAHTDVVTAAASVYDPASKASERTASRRPLSEQTP